MASIFVAFYDSVSIGLGLAFKKVFENTGCSDTVMQVTGILSYTIYNGIYIFGLGMSWLAVNKLAESRITLWAIKMYLDEK